MFQNWNILQFNKIKIFEKVDRRPGRSSCFLHVLLKEISSPNLCTIFNHKLRLVFLTVLFDGKNLVMY